MKTYQIIIASTLFALSQSASANEGGDISYPKVASVSVKSRAQVVAEFNVSKTAGQLPALGERGDSVLQFGTSRSREEVCEEVFSAQRLAVARNALNTY